MIPTQGIELHELVSVAAVIVGALWAIGIQRDLDGALERLRSRPGRGVGDVSGPSGSTSSCGTGATLCQHDSEFLVREAARADTHREALDACYKVIDGTK